MKEKRKAKNYWTKKRCIEEAKKHKSRSLFKKNAGGAYNCAKENKWLDEICSNMEIAGNRFKRLVYVYEFLDGSIYVGLTHDVIERDNKHKRDKRSKVYQYIKETKTMPTLTYSGYMHVNEAKLLEGKTVEKYKKEGYKILNVSPTGGLGGYLRWTFEKCLNEALKYGTRIEFARKSGSAYNSARRYGWLEKVCSHMHTVKTNPIGYWTKVRCFEEAVKYKTTSDLPTGAYHAMLRNNWLVELCPHMKLQKPNGYWTKERCLEEALKHKSKTSFQHAIGGAYRISLDKGWLNEICRHMNYIKK